MFPSKSLLRPLAFMLLVLAGAHYEVARQVSTPPQALFYECGHRSYLHGVYTYTDCTENNYVVVCKKVGWTSCVCQRLEGDSIAQVDVDVYSDCFVFQGRCLKWCSESALAKAL